MLVWWLFKIKLITLIWSAAEHKLPFLFLPTHQPNKFSPHKKRQSSPQTVEVFRPRLYFIYFVLLCVMPNVKWTLLMHWFRWFDNWNKRAREYTFVSPNHIPREAGRHQKFTTASGKVAAVSTGKNRGRGWYVFHHKINNLCKDHSAMAPSARPLPLYVARSLGRDRDLTKCQNVEQSTTPSTEIVGCRKRKDKLHLKNWLQIQGERGHDWFRLSSKSVHYITSVHFPFCKR